MCYFSCNAEGNAHNKEKKDETFLDERHFQGKEESRGLQQLLQIKNS